MEDQAEYKTDYKIELPRDIVGNNALRNACNGQASPHEESPLNDERFARILSNANSLAGILYNSDSMLNSKVDALLGAVPRDKCGTKPKTNTNLVDEILTAQETALKAALAIQERIATI